MVAWPVVGVAVLLLLSVREWDMSAASVVGVIGGTAAAHAGCGLVVWVPAGAWVSRRVAGVARPAAFAALGVLIGTVLTLVLVLLSGNASWPGSLGVVGLNAAGAGLASVLGWAVVVARGRRSRIRR